MKSQCLPFAQIPHTTRLFTDFLKYSPEVQPFYPHSPHFSEWLLAEASKLEIRSRPPRTGRCDSERQNKSWDASPQTLANLDSLSEWSRRDRDRAASRSFWRAYVRHLQGSDRG